MIVLLLTSLLAGLPEAGISAAATDSGQAPPLVERPVVSPPPRPALGDTVVVLPEVRVERERPLSEARRRLPTAFVSELPTRRSQRALETLGDVLAMAAGIHVQQYGGLGAFSTMSLRGLPAGHVTIFLDGVPLTSAAHGVISLGDLPVTAIERIEIYRGLSPLGLGSPTPGGAINLVTLAAPERRELAIVRGSFATWESRASASATRKGLSGLVHFGYQGSEGDFRYLDDNGTPFNATDDSVHARVNNRFDATTAIASLTWRPHPNLSANLREDFFHKAQGVPGLGAVPALHPRLAFERSLTQLDLSLAPAGSWPSARLRSALGFERARFRDQTAELGLGGHDTDDRIANGGVDLALEWPSRPRILAAQLAGSLRADQARLSDAADGRDDPPPGRRTVEGLMAGLELRPMGEVIVLHAAFRRDWLRDRLRWLGPGGLLQQSAVTRQLTTPQLGARTALPLGFELRGNWTRADRVPDFLELFGNQGSVLGNPALRPEQAESWDAGAAWGSPAGRPIGGSLVWAHFESRAKDLVLYVRNSQSSVRAQNIARARIHGDELSVRVTTSIGLEASTSFTWQDARDDGPVSYWNGRRLPQRPAREAYARLDWRSGRLGAGADLHLIGDNFLDRYNGQPVPSRALLGASLSLTPLARGPRMIVEGKNLGDDRAVDVAGFPLPGRSVFVSCEARLGRPPLHEP